MLLQPLAWFTHLVRACVRLQPSSCVLFLPPCMSHSEQLRQLAVQLASLASLEDVVTHGLHLLESHSGLVAPIAAADRALPALLARPRSRSRSPSPTQRRIAAARSSSASAAPLAWHSRAALSLRSSAQAPSTALTLRHPLLAPRTLWTPPARLAPPSLHTPRAAFADPRVCRPAGSSAFSWRRSRDKRWRYTRRHAKRSMWREIEPQDLRCLAMWACCEDTLTTTTPATPSCSCALTCRACAAVWHVGA